MTTQLIKMSFQPFLACYDSVEEKKKSRTFDTEITLKHLENPKKRKRASSKGADELPFEDCSDKELSQILMELTRKIHADCEKYLNPKTEIPADISKSSDPMVIDSEHRGWQEPDFTAWGTQINHPTLHSPEYSEWMVPTPPSEYNPEYKFSPTFSEYLIKTMRADHDQGFPKGVKTVSDFLTNHLVQLEKDLDRAWQTAEIKRESIRNIEEASDFLIGRILLEAALGNTTDEVHEMELELHHAQGLLMEWLGKAEQKVCKPHNNPINLWNYRIYQERIYSKLKRFSLETLKELQLGLENYCDHYAIYFLGETWANEREEKWWSDHLTK
ncbi:uncharacterized protein EI90DRAFT_3134101 [Cantharellus anzutake]|uniref:uncharacterized protein n=1 Tax=Cantharellus anzutake TaxID=1750568 RepID=UPI001907A8E3|nr:uncharacterized protein EI90DRAFT_3134101 [Cantharellus anzutake]KAF8316952.1 hypothetical protein EI90DRAFT_3134101 [Cantharellus anzutake]